MVRRRTGGAKINEEITPRLSKWLTTFSENLRFLRYSKKLNQKEFAAKIGLGSCGPPISQYECGHRFPHLYTYLRIVEFFERSPGDLFERLFPYKEMPSLNIIYLPEGCPIVAHETYIDTARWIETPTYTRDLEVKVLNRTGNDYSNVLLPPPHGIEFVLGQLELSEVNSLEQLRGKPVTAYYQMSVQGEMKGIAIHWRSRS